MKRIFALLLAGTLALSLFGCASGSTETGTGDATTSGGTSSSAATEQSEASGDVTTVQFWGHINESWNQSHKDTIERFNASQSDIKVVPTFFPYNDFEAKIQTSLLSGGEGADLYEIWGGWAMDFIAADALSPVPAQFMAELVQDCYEPVIGAFKGDDDTTYYGVPLEYNIEYGGMLVSKPKFEELGLSYPTTWDETIAIARQTSVQDGELMEMRGFEFTTNDTLCAIFLSMILSQGGEYLVDGKFSLSTPEANTALQTMVDYIVVDGLTNLDSATGAAGADIESYVFFARDEAMIVPRGPWVIAELEFAYDKAYGTDFDYIPQPFFGDVKAFPSETGWGMCVPKASKNADAAWVYTEFFLEKENLEQHNINCGMIPPRKSIAEDPAYVQALPFSAPLLEVLQYGKFIGPFNTDLFKDNLRTVFVSLCTNDGTYASTADALSALESKLNTDLKLG